MSPRRSSRSRTNCFSRFTTRNRILSWRSCPARQIYMWGGLVRRRLHNITAILPGSARNICQCKVRDIGLWWAGRESVSKPAWNWLISSCSCLEWLVGPSQEHQYTSWTSYVFMYFQYLCSTILWYMGPSCEDLWKTCELMPPGGLLIFLKISHVTPDLSDLATRCPCIQGPPRSIRSHHKISL